MSRSSRRRLRACVPLGAAVLLLAAIFVWDAGRSPAAACATTPCNNLPDLTAEVLAQYYEEVENYQR